MILKGSQRGGAKQLGLHLMRTDDNEHVEVHDVRGFVSEEVIGALKEAYAVSRGTQCRQFLFSLSLNPPQTEAVPVAAFEDTLERIEKKLGLEGQPRIVVFHEKEGRRHAHAVWSRIDAGTMTARNLPYFKSKLRDISRELFLEHDWKMPQGLVNSAERDPCNFTLAEWQQAQRMGRNARDLKTMIQDCWAVSDTKAAFVHALSERGLILARGDRRGHVAVTHEGEVLSIARYADRKAREVRAKLGAPDDLPIVSEARELIAQNMTAAFKRHGREALFLKARALAPLERRRIEMTRRHRAERTKLDEGQKRRWIEEMRARSLRLNGGLKGLWQRLTGRYGRIRRQNEREAYAALQRDRDQRQAVVGVQHVERRELQKLIAAARGRHAGLLRDIRRDRDRIRAQLQAADGTASPVRRRGRRSGSSIGVEPEPEP